MSRQLAGAVLQHIPERCDIFVDRLPLFGGRYGRPLGRHSEMALNECRQIECGIILVGPIVGQDRVEGGGSAEQIAERAASKDASIRKNTTIARNAALNGRDRRAFTPDRWLAEVISSILSTWAPPLREGHSRRAALPIRCSC
jgi:hypothetical protein